MLTTHAVTSCMSIAQLTELQKIKHTPASTLNFASAGCDIGAQC